MLCCDCLFVCIGGSLDILGDGLARLGALVRGLVVDVEARVLGVPLLALHVLVVVEGVLGAPQLRAAVGVLGRGEGPQLLGQAGLVLDDLSFALP